VVAVIGDDKAVILKAHPRSTKLPLSDYIKAFDFARIEKALAKPPRTDFGVTVATFAPLTKGATMRVVTDWCGQPKWEYIGKKEDMRTLWTYNLKDGSRVLGIFQGQQLESLHHEMADRNKVDLLK